MGIFSKGPSASDMIQAQDKSNQKAQKLNAINQYSPWGSTEFQRKNGKVRSQTITLAPELMNLFQTQGNVANRLGRKASRMAQQLDSKLFDVQSDVGGSDQVRKAYYDQGLAQLQPEMDRQRNLMETQLSERGLPFGSQIGNTERDRYQTGVSNSLADLTQRATLAGGAEQDRLIRNAIAERNQGYNEIANMLGSSPQMPMPGFQQLGQIAPTNVANAYQMANQNQQGAKGGLGSLIGSGMNLGSTFL